MATYKVLEVDLAEVDGGEGGIAGASATGIDSNIDGIVFSGSKVRELLHSAQSGGDRDRLSVETSKELFNVDVHPKTKKRRKEKDMPSKIRRLVRHHQRQILSLELVQLSNGLVEVHHLLHLLRRLEIGGQVGLVPTLHKERRSVF